MTVFEHFFGLGLAIAGSSFGLLLGGFVWHFTELRKLIPRLFDKYKQDELSENLARLDKRLLRTTRTIFFSRFFTAFGLFNSYIGILNN